MRNSKSNGFSIFQIVMIGLMAAMTYVTTMIRFPLFESKVTVGNAVCVLNGLLFGPGAGFLASGIGTMLYDLMTGYGAESLITFVSKGCISLVSGLIAGRLINQAELRPGKDDARLIIGCVLGSLTYVALYMLKTFIFGLTVNGLTLEATGVKMLSKLPASLINAVFASVAAPILYRALHGALRKAGLGERENKNK